MKPFDLEKAKAGAKVVTRDGLDVTILTFNRRDVAGRSIVALVHGTKQDQLLTLTKDGKFTSGQNSCLDLHMAPVKREGWVNIYPNDSTGVTIHPSRSLADKSDVHKVRIDCVRIEWEE